jgi:hypothetical protein
MASTTYIREPLPGRDPIREEVPWVDLASAGQLDPPSNAVGTRGEKEIRVWKRELGFGDNK